MYELPINVSFNDVILMIIYVKALNFGIRKLCLLVEKIFCSVTELTWFNFHVEIAICKRYFQDYLLISHLRLWAWIIKNGWKLSRNTKQWRVENSRWNQRKTHLWAFGIKKFMAFDSKISSSPPLKRPGLL